MPLIAPSEHHPTDRRVLAVCGLRGRLRTTEQRLPAVGGWFCRLAGAAVGRWWSCGGGFAAAGPLAHWLVGSLVLVLAWVPVLMLGLGLVLLPVLLVVVVLVVVMVVLVMVVSVVVALVVVALLWLVVLVARDM